MKLFDDAMIDELLKEHQYDDDIAYMLRVIADGWNKLGQAGNEIDREDRAEMRA